MTAKYEPPEAIFAVHEWLDEEIRNIAKDSRAPYDRDAAMSLHALAADLYALGVADGVAQERGRASAQRLRDNDAQMHADLAPRDKETEA